MFKPTLLAGFAVLSALAVVAAILLPSPPGALQADLVWGAIIAALIIPAPVVWAFLLAVMLWASWPLLRHISRRIWAFLGFALACVALSGCTGLQAIAGFNNALLPQLKPVDVRIHTDVTCGDMAGQVLGISAGQMSAQAAVAIVQFCERRDATQTLQMDPQGARKALDQAITHAASPATVVAKAVGAP